MEALALVRTRGCPRDDLWSRDWIICAKDASEDLRRAMLQFMSFDVELVREICAVKVECGMALLYIGMQFNYPAAAAMWAFGEVDDIVLEPWRGAWGLSTEESARLYLSTSARLAYGGRPWFRFARENI